MTDELNAAAAAAAALVAAALVAAGQQMCVCFLSALLLVGFDLQEQNAGCSPLPGLPVHWRESTKNHTVKVKVVRICAK